MVFMTDEELDRLLAEDVPYIDLTTALLGISACRGKLTFAARAETVLAGTEIVQRICERLGLRVVLCRTSGTVMPAGECFLEAQGRAEELHMAWKVCLNILEYSSGIATRTKTLVQLAQEAAPGIAIITTRKSFPGTKKLALQAILAGGAYPHRLGLSETLLLFAQHTNFLHSDAELEQRLRAMHQKVCEKKIIFEVKTSEEARKMLDFSIDGLQFDKFPAETLHALLPELRARRPEICLIAAGGIQEKNVREYAAAGVDAIATTAVYFGKPADICAKIEEL